MSARLAGPLPWPDLVRPLADAEDGLARLDERLAKSPIRDGWIARTHFSDACAALWLEGEAVHVEDLVLNDAAMDVRTPTHELARARAALSARRRIAAAAPDWPLSDAGIAGLRGRAGDAGTGAEPSETGRAGDLDEEGDDAPYGFDDTDDPPDIDPRFADAFAAVDAAMAKTNRPVAGDRGARREKDPLIHDLDWDEDARLDEWRALMDETGALPATLEAAILLDAWETIAPLER